MNKRGLEPESSDYGRIPDPETPGCFRRMKKQNVASNSLSISDLKFDRGARASTIRKGFVGFDSPVYIKGRFVATRDLNIKFGQDSNLVLRVTKRYSDTLLQFLILVAKVMQLGEKQKMYNPVSGFNVKYLRVKSTGILLDLVRPHLKPARDCVELDCVIAVSGVTFGNGNLVHLCMKMHDISVPSLLVTNGMDDTSTSLQVLGELPSTLRLCDIEDKEPRFHAFVEPVNLYGTFTLSHIEDIPISKKSNVVFIMKNSDRLIFNDFVWSLSKCLHIGSDKNIVNPLCDLKLHVRMHSDLVSYMYPYLVDKPETKYYCEMVVFGVFLSGSNVYMCMDTRDVNVCER